jgi:tetratricopeptide (TPR) repeat protein
MDPDLAKRYAEYRRFREKGKESLQQNAYGKAMEYYSRAIDEALRIGKTMTPGENGYLGLVPAEQRARYCDSAAEHTVSICPGCSRYLELPVCYANRAYALTHLKKFREALVDAERAIALAPTWAKVCALAASFDALFV